MLNKQATDRFAELNATYVIDQNTGAILGEAKNTTGYYVAVPPSVLTKSIHGIVPYGFGTLHIECADDTKDPILYLGIWNNKGMVYPEYSIRVLDRETAEYIGRKYKQIAIWDIEKGTEVTL